MTNQESSQHQQIAFPHGVVNQVALVIGVLLLVVAGSTLTAQLFSRHRLAFRPVEQQDVILDVLSLGFLIALLTVRHVRNNFSLLWIAILGARLVSWIGKSAFYVPESILLGWEFFYTVSNIVAIMLFCFALLKGEKVDRFVIEAPISLVAKVMKLEIKEQVEKT